MEIQGKGEEGILLTNGDANIFYVKDTSDVLRGVYVSWTHCGWRVLARSVEDPGVWCAGLRIFYRNSVA